MFVLQSPERARSLGLLGAKAQFAGGTADWAGYFAFVAQIAALGFGAWFPWSVPSMLSGVAGPQQAGPGSLSIAGVVVVGAATSVATMILVGTRRRRPVAPRQTHVGADATPGGLVLLHQDWGCSTLIQWVSCGA